MVSEMNYEPIFKQHRITEELTKRSIKIKEARELKEKKIKDEEDLIV